MLKQIWYLYIREVKSMVRQPIWIVMSLTMPLMFLAFYAPLLMTMGGLDLTIAEVFDDFVPRILTMIAFSAGLSGGYDMVIDLRTGVIERFRVTSARRSSMLLAKVMYSITAFLVPAMILLLIALPFGFSMNFGGLVILILLLSMLTAVFAAFASAIALKVKEMGSVAAVSSGIQMPMMLLSGMFLRITSAAPTWLYTLAHFNPLFYTVEASRYLAEGAFTNNYVFYAFGIVTLLAVLTMWWATRVYRSAVK